MCRNFQWLVFFAWLIPLSPLLCSEEVGSCYDPCLLKGLCESCSLTMASLWIVKPWKALCKAELCPSGHLRSECVVTDPWGPEWRNHSPHQTSACQPCALEGCPCPSHWQSCTPSSGGGADTSLWSPREWQSQEWSPSLVIHHLCLADLWVTFWMY